MISSPPAVAAGDVLTLEELRHLRRTSTVRGLALVLHAWSVIAAAMAVYAWWPSPFVLVLAMMVVGSRQLGLAVLMHEGSHWLLSPRSVVNTRVARWLCGYPVWIDLGRYRRRHHLHHRYTQQAGDPDVDVGRSQPASARALLWAALRDLSSWTFWIRRGDVAGLARAAHALVAAARPIAVNAALFGALAALGRWEVYVFLWLLPLATWYQLVTRLRAIAEHVATSGEEDPLRNTRTTQAGPLARAFLAPYWVNYHVEHHLFVSVPCWKLRSAHALLLGKGYGPRMELAASYGDVLSRATRARAGSPI